MIREKKTEPATGSPVSTQAVGDTVHLEQFDESLVSGTRVAGADDGL